MGGQCGQIKVWRGTDYAEEPQGITREGKGCLHKCPGREKVLASTSLVLRPRPALKSCETLGKLLEFSVPECLTSKMGKW